MRSSLSLSLLSVLCGFAPLVQSATVTYNFNISWVYANPDGEYVRPTIGINGQWPLPAITANVGDQVVVNVNNQLGNQTTSLHFHGLYQNGTNDMDGPAGATQCPIPIGGSFTYTFSINQTGTYWYHSHAHGQYPDGLRGALIINDPNSPHKEDYDEEIVLTLSDWYHDSMIDLLASFVNIADPTGAEPVPDSALMNDTQNISVSVQPGKTYMFRIINLGAFAGHYLWFEDHTMSIVEVDGIYTEKADADMLYITAAQRYSVLVTMKNSTSTNFAFVSSMDQDVFDPTRTPDGLNPNVTSWLVYDKSKSLPDPAMLDMFDPFDDFTLVPQDRMKLYDKVDHSITLNFRMGDLENGFNYAFFNNVTYIQPKVPTLYTALSSGADANNVAIYGGNTNAFILEQDEVVEIVVNSLDTGKHPFHLHGHNFQAVARSDDNMGAYAGNVSLPTSPMRRDTFMVNPFGNIVLRFRADNPGIWLFHCHIEWHINTGLVATMIEAPLQLQKTLKVPDDHYKACQALDMPYAGNAAGNTQDLFDLDGEYTQPGPPPNGFQAKGIVAMTFSVLSGVLGMGAIVWYGLAELGADEVAAARNAVIEITGHS